MSLDCQSAWRTQSMGPADRPRHGPPDPNRFSGWATPSMGSKANGSGVFQAHDTQFCDAMVSRPFCSRTKSAGRAIYGETPHEIGTEYPSRGATGSKDV